jgi:hypothetical protein
MEVSFREVSHERENTMARKYSPAASTKVEKAIGPQADLNLGLKYFLNGTLVSNIILDTSQGATDMIDYVATDPTGLAAISTRTILILPAQAGEAPVPPLVPDYTASTTIPAATSSTAQ